MARGNGQWRNLDGQNVLVVFQGPQAYISPSFYATKRETGKVVPTWNYAMVQARGVAKLRADAEWLDKQIGALTSRHEGLRSPSWAVTDAPRTFIESQIRGIIGVEIEIQASRASGKSARTGQKPTGAVSPKGWQAMRLKWSRWLGNTDVSNFYIDKVRSMF